MTVLDGFDTRRVEVDGVGIHTAVAGTGPPLLLLHGYPQHSWMWRQVAPALAERFTVVVTDLRGYGRSDKPAPDADGERYSKRTMAVEQLGVMRELGFERFSVVSHDRGARVAYRLGLDRPDVVERLVLLDIVPTGHVLTHVDLTLASSYFHWFFLATGGDVPERLLAAEPEFWIRAMIERLLAPGARISDEVMDDYVRCFGDPAMIAASCADYRSGASVDLEHDRADHDAGRRLACPTLVLWGAQGFVGRAYEPLEVWREWADDVRGHALDAGHFLPEEVPDEVVDEVLAFLA